MTSVCILSAAWQRFDVTRLVLEQRQRMCVELAARGVDAGMLIVADDENLEIAAEYGSETVEAPNKPLGAKWNAGLHHAAEMFDWICWVGSDDWIHPSVFDPIIDTAPAERAQIYSGRRLAIVDLRAGRLQRLESPSPFGAIPWLLDARLIRNAIRRQNGTRIGPLKPNENRGLDGALIRGIRLGRVNFSWDFSDQSDFRCVDFKTRTNITPFEGLARNLGVGDPEPAWTTLADHFPADLVAKAAALSERLTGGELECAA